MDLGRGIELGAPITSFYRSLACLPVVGLAVLMGGAGKQQKIPIWIFYDEIPRAPGLLF